MCARIRVLCASVGVRAHVCAFAYQLTQRSAPSPYRRAFWLKKMADTHKLKERPLEAAINYLELCVHAQIVAASSGDKLPLPLLGAGLVFPFIDFEALSHAFICPADGPVGRNAFLAAKEHVELFGPDSVLQCVDLPLCNPINGSCSPAKIWRVRVCA